MSIFSFDSDSPRRPESDLVGSVIVRVHKKKRKKAEDHWHRAAAAARPLADVQKPPYKKKIKKVETCCAGFFLFPCSF